MVITDRATSNFLEQEAIARQEMATFSTRLAKKLRAAGYVVRRFDDEIEVSKKAEDRG